jgi:hypothetical protein
MYGLRLHFRVLFPIECTAFTSVRNLARHAGIDIFKRLACAMTTPPTTSS